MNYKMVCQVVGRVIAIEGVLMLLPLLTALICGEHVTGFLLTILFAAVVSVVLQLCFKPKTRVLYAREGFVIVALSWIALSLIGALPFTLEGEIPSYIDAVFETVSGFTTTGASILTNVESLSNSLLFWRSFTHWIGGMGVLVFLMAVLPMSEGYSMHIMRAEVPGPVVGKLVPKVRRSSIILYLIYTGMTVLEVILLMLGHMPFYDALLHAFATAGTGGFSLRSLSIGYYNSTYIDLVVSIFMILFGINFNLYFLLLLKRFKSALRNEEMLCYLGIIAFATITIALNIRQIYGGFLVAMRYSFFQVSSIMTTTGFSTANFDQWPEYSRAMLVLLMFIGACAGSTGGGLKVSRILILFKATHAELRRLLKPRSYNAVTLNGAVMDRQTIYSTMVFFFLYIAITFLACLLLSLENFDLTTIFTSVIACLSNVGPGLSLVGPMGNYSMFSGASKLLLSLCMLLGRLEIYPLLLLLAPSIWTKSRSLHS